ncbi:MAG: hypothetical protein R2844_06695 [Caldilineales bacterium]
MKRYLAVLVLGLLLLAAAAVVWAFAGRVSYQQPSQQLAVRPRLDSPGINVALETYSPADREAALDAIAAAGFGWIRQRFPWSEIEAQPGEFDWQTWDAIVDSAAGRSLEVVAVLDGSPAWARSREDAANPLAPPASRADYGAFAAAFAQRYGDRLRFYQVWDEPNIAPHWGDRPVEAADYAGLLREATVQLRGADPDAVVVAGALAPTVEAGGLNQSDLTYLDDLYRTGGAPWFDLAAAQPYGFDQAPDQAPGTDRLNFRRAELLRQVMVANGDDATALLIASYGWHATPPGDPEESPWKSVTLDQQAHWAREANDWARDNWPWNAGMAWAWWQPPQPAGDPHWGFAALTPEGEPRPVLAGLQEANSASRPVEAAPGSPDVTQTGGATADDVVVTETGGWRLVGQAADPPHDASVDNNALVVAFNGTGLALQVQRGPFWGFLDVTVDGQPANALPRDAAGRSYLVLHDPLGGQELVTLADGLKDGPHRAELRATGGWEQWPVLAFVASHNQPPAWPAPLGWALGLAGLVLSGVGVAGLARRDDGPSAGPEALVTLADRVSPAIRYAVLAVLWIAVIALPGALQVAALGLMFLWFIAVPDAGLFSLAVAAPCSWSRSPSLADPSVRQS